MGAFRIHLALVLNAKHLIALGLLAAGLTHAEELAIEPKPFDIVHTLDAKVMPTGEVPLIKIDAKAWQTFSITQLAAHGSSVKKGDVLFAADTRDIDKKLESLKRQIAASELTIAETQDTLAKLEETADRRLAAAKREAAEAKELLEYYTAAGRKAEEDEARQSIKRSEQYLANEKEELRQLKQMYEADDLTEDTEEIILTRQQYAVESAELMVRLNKLRQGRELEVAIPRKAEAIARGADSTAIALKYAERHIPREINQTKAQLTSLIAGLDKDRGLLADLEGDRKLFEFKAAADGIFYHGAIKDKRWVTGDLLRGLRVGGSAPRHTAFASLVPANATYELIAQTDAAKVRQLADKTSGIATLAGTETQGAELSSIPVSVSARSLVPNLQGKYEVSLKAEWPKGLNPAVGNPAKARLLVYENDKAILVPAKALKFGSKGWSVEVKLADGKTERRAVGRGAQSGEQVEILSGLEVGQVIIVPGK